MITFSVKDRLHPSWRKKGRKRGIYPWTEVEEYGAHVTLSVHTAPKGEKESRKVEIFRLRTLALALDRTNVTLKLWEDAKKLSKPSIRLRKPDGSGDLSSIRYYSAAQVINMHKVWAYKYQARCHGMSAETFEEMLAAFRTILELRYLDWYIVDDNGNIDLSGKDYRPDGTAVKTAVTTNSPRL